MIRFRAALLATVATLVALAPISANATATVTSPALSSTAWTDLGAGPMRLFGSGQNTRYAISDSSPAPTDKGFAVGDTPVDVSTSSHVWVISTNPQFPAFATYAPTTAGSVTATNPSVGANGAAIPTSSTQIGVKDAGGNLQPASAANPVPVSGVATPDVATNTSITVQDTGTTCASTPAPVQTQCTGAPTAGSVASVAVAGQQGAAVVASLTSGTVATVNFSSEFSWDGGTTWYGRGLFLDSNLAPIWKNGIANSAFSGSISIPPGATNYRVRAAGLTGTSPNINLKIILTQSNSGTYVYNLPTAGAGTSSVAAVNIQGETGGLPVITNQTQLAGSTLSVPTATGVAPAGGALVPNVNANITGGSVTATFGQWAPNGNNAQLTVGATSSSVALPAGVVVTVDNTGANTALFRLGVGSATATSADTAVPSGGFKCVTVGSNTVLGAIETAGATTLNINGGAGGCAGAGGGGGASSSGNVFQANLFVPNSGNPGTANTATTTQLFAASGSLTIYLVNYSFAVDQAATTNGDFQIVSGTGSNCATSQVPETPAYSFAGGGGMQEGSVGVLGSTAPGAALCVKTTTTNLVRYRVGVVQQ